MKAITICQPWAWAIAAGHKCVENRTWPTRHRGLLAIHAGLSRDWLDAGNAFLATRSEWAPPPVESLVFGAVIAVVDLVDCVPFSDLSEPSPFAGGPHCWLLRNVRRLDEPVVVTGKQATWILPLDVEAAVMAQLSQHAVAS